MLVDIAGTRPLPLRRVAGREEGDRHRQLLRRLDAVQGAHRLGAGSRACAEGFARTFDYYRQHAGALCLTVTVPFNALTPGEDAGDVRAAIDRVIASGWFVLGPEVEAFESEFAAASGVAHAVGVGTGTDAITLILRALDIGPGRRSDHAAAVGRVLRAGGDDGRRAAGVRRHRSRTPDARSRPRPRPPSRRARAPSCRCISTASPRTWPRRGARRAAQPGDRRRRRAGAPGDRGAAAGRHDRRRRRVQLLSDEEPRRARRRRRGGRRATRAGGAHQAVAQRRPDRRAITTRKPAPTAASTKCRRRSCARGYRYLRGWTESAARSRRRYRAGIAGAGVTVPPSSTPATSITCSRS